MKKIKLTQGKYAIVDDEDYHYLSRFNWRYCLIDNLSSAKRLLTNKFGRIDISIEDFILKRPIGSARKMIFKNGNRLDFRKNNLDFIGIEGVTQRAKKQKNTSSIYKGVTKNTRKVKNLSRIRGKKWLAQIEKNISGKRCWFKKGFDDEKEAAKWYNKQAIKLFGKFAYQNKIK